MYIYTLHIHILRVYIYIYHYISNGMLTWDFFSSANKKDPKRMLGQSDFIFSNVLKGNAHMADSNPELNLHKTYCKISRPSGTNRVFKTLQHLFFSGHVHKPTRAINANAKKMLIFLSVVRKDKIMGCWHPALRKVSKDLRLQPPPPILWGLRDLPPLRRLRSCTSCRASLEKSGDFSMDSTPSQKVMFYHLSNRGFSNTSVV